jgi:GntR family transcriptional regulator
MKLVRDPIYLQLNQALRELLESGEFTEGQQFLTEREIGERFAVSRPTANKALANLVAEGRLQFRKGVGTFVARPKLGYELRQLASFTANAKASGKTPATRVLKFERISAADISDDEARERLKVPDSDAVFYMERLRFADAQPVIHELRFVSASACPSLSKADVQGSIYSAFQEKHGLAISGAEQTMRAVALSSTLCEMLQVPLHSPALEVRAVGFLQTGQPLWWERTLYRGDAYAFHTHLGPIAGW